jgi:hypothetical protein
LEIGDLELLEPCIEKLPHIDGIEEPDDTAILYEAELFVPDDERHDWHARISLIEEGRKLYGSDG